MPADKKSSIKQFSQNPLWFRGINGVWRNSYFLGTRIRLEKDDLIRSARKITGLTDLGKDFVDEPLERLLRSVNEEANLHPVGRFITRERFVSLLSIRLRAEYFFKKHPQILEQPLYPVWLIVGLQRTGTTKLQRLLAVDADHRVIPSWEVINPVPIDLDLYDISGWDNRAGLQVRQGGQPLPLASSAAYPHRKDKRISVANTSVRALKIMSPGFFAIHPIDAMQPEEDILMLDVSFLSTTPEAMMHVPSYASWLESTDQSAAYAYAAKMLKFLQWMKPARRWILKTPHHLEFPDLIEKHFGDVHFIWPHRNLYESVPSFLSMVTCNRMIFSDQVDERQVARHWVRKTGYMLGKAIDYRFKEGNETKFTDIDYRELLQDSIPALSQIYRQNGGLQPELVEKFRKHELANPHRKNGVHHYSLADFGLTGSDIDQHTMHYQEIFNRLYGC
ncbi:MAG: sulfotransferase [Bacteroidota bacterium]